MKSAQMLAITDFHTITHAMNASVNLTLYDDTFGLQGYWTFPSYSEYEYEPDSDKFDLKSGDVLSFIYTDANFSPISRKI